MIREILFRGKRGDNGEWVEGDFIHGVGAKNGKSYILPIKTNLAYPSGCDPLDGFNVIPATVGQFTGLLDKNGKKIFEGDIVNSHAQFEEPYIREVVYGGFKPLTGFNLCKMNEPHFEIIGNIHENPELCPTNE